MNIITAYKGMKEYADKVEINNCEGTEELWQEIVIKPYWAQWAEGQFNEDRIKDEMKNPIKNTQKLKEAVKLIEEAQIENFIIREYERIISLLPAMEENIAICIYADLDLDETTNGVVGSCVGDNMLLRINPFIKAWKSYIPWVVAHEHHHSVWGYDYFFTKGNRTQTLLTAIICEGLADAFGKIAAPELSPFWTRAISGEEEKLQWEALKEYINLETSYEVHVRFFFGNEKTPAYTGYTIGYNIVQGFMKNNPKTTLREMLEMEADKFLAASGYMNLK